MLVTVSEQCDQKIMSLREEEKQGKLQMYRNKTNLHHIMSTRTWSAQEHLLYC